MNMSKNGRLMKLPKRGRALIFTDLHGDLDDYNKYLEKWDFNDPDCHIIIAGDFIHSIYKKD
ncbi:MAG: serine/threonine protein phosphatase, partial [Methanobrevibacter sp.]|nr:serine/threonine protein phosphatase [Methanobrevibacter sp.]